MEDRYSIADFIRWLEKYVNPDDEFTASQIAQIIGKAMVSFFEDSGTPY